ncbi:FMN-binding protein [Pseudothermotoga sp.]|uniref:FMN-binding protein n=1 Tax=Pseudothermotoga sp. TaxID=2033661 RepID=UPI0031F71301
MKRFLIPSLITVLSLVLIVFMYGNSASKVHRDGTFVAASQGDKYGYVAVTLTIENDKIKNVAIKEFDGFGVEKLYDVYGAYFPILKQAHETLAKRIVEANSWQVDVFTGATGTSKKVMEAVKFALEKAKVEPSQTKYLSGTFMGVSDFTARGHAVAWVTIENDKITKVIFEETTPSLKDGKPVLDAAGRQVWVFKGGDYPWPEFHQAKEAVAKAIIEKQTYQVDVYTGATSSSNKFIQAVQRALEWAKARQ